MYKPLNGVSPDSAVCDRESPVECLCRASQWCHMTWVQDWEAASAARTRNTELGIETITWGVRDREKERIPSKG